MKIQQKKGYSEGKPTIVWDYSRVQRYLVYQCCSVWVYTTLLTFLFCILSTLEFGALGVWKPFSECGARAGWVSTLDSAWLLLLRESALILKQAAIKYQSRKTWMEPIYFTTLDLQRFPPRLAIFSWLDNLLWRASHLHDLTSLFINSPHSHLSDVHRPSDETCSYKIHSKFGSLWNVQ